MLCKHQACSGSRPSSCQRGSTALHHLPSASPTTPGTVAGRARPAHRQQAGARQRRQAAARCSGRPGTAESTTRTDAAAAADAVTVALASGNGSGPDAAEESVVTTFRWPAALDGKQVSVIGSFGNWDAPLALGKSPETGDFVRSVALPPGTYQYKYVVDGQWTTSPCEPITADGGGFFNNQRLVAPGTTFVWKQQWGGQEIFVTGDFNAWAELIPLQRASDGTEFTVECSLPPGTYGYQFLVDGTWTTSPEAPVGPDDAGHYCNKVTVEAPTAFHIFYATGWPEAVLQVRALNGDGTPHTPGWREVPMFSTPSRAQPGGGAWKTAVVPATGEALGGPPRLQFWVTNGDGRADRPPNGGHYELASPGGYKLAGGRLTPFPQARQPPTMLVSDLDGTMVGEGAEADAATAAFTAYWEGSAALVGSVLVYNTGRSLGQFQALLRDKAGALALPDALITAVGTKIFLLECEEGRGQADGASWREDLQWSRRLDQGWDLSRVKQVAGGAVDACNGDGAGWLDSGIEHPHRIALSVRLDRLERVLDHLRAGFEREQVQVRIIVSGTGEWRYVDCVAQRGGKLEALEYVRTLFGIPHARCVAAGDSGNDTLMLDGENLALIVGNAQPELVDWMMAQPQSARCVYTDAAMARGILEGLSRHGLY